MGPAEHLNEEVAGGGGFEPPLRGPEPRVLPLDDPPATASAASSIRGAVGQVNELVGKSADRGLQAPARAEARDLRRRDLDRLARARVAPVARGPARDHERPEAGNCHAP